MNRLLGAVCAPLYRQYSSAIARTAPAFSRLLVAAAVLPALSVLPRSAIAQAAAEANAAGALATFPVLALGGDRLTIAWSERSADEDEHAGHAAPGAPTGLKSVGASRVIVREGTIE